MANEMGAFYRAQAQAAGFLDSDTALKRGPTGKRGANPAMRREIAWEAMNMGARKRACVRIYGRPCIF